MRPRHWISRQRRHVHPGWCRPEGFDRSRSSVPWRLNGSFTSKCSGLLQCSCNECNVSCRSMMEGPEGLYQGGLEIGQGSTTALQCKGLPEPNYLFCSAVLPQSRLEYYRSYNASWYNPAQYASVVADVSLDQLQTCAESVEALPQSNSTILNFVCAGCVYPRGRICGFSTLLHSRHEVL